MVLIRVWFRKHALQWIALRWRRQPTLLSLLHLNPSNHTTYRLTPPKRPPPTFTGDGRFLFPCYFYRDATFILPHARRQYSFHHSPDCSWWCFPEKFSHPPNKLYPHGWILRSVSTPRILYSPIQYRLRPDCLCIVAEFVLRNGEKFGIILHIRIPNTALARKGRGLLWLNHYTR